MIMSYNYLQASRKKFNNDMRDMTNLFIYSHAHYKFNGTNLIADISWNSPVTFGEALRYIMRTMVDNDGFRDIEIRSSLNSDLVGIHSEYGYDMIIYGYGVKQNQHNSACVMFDHAIDKSCNLKMDTAKEYFMSYHEDIMGCMY